MRSVATLRRQITKLAAVTKSKQKRIRQDSQDFQDGQDKDSNAMPISIDSSCES